MKAAIDESTPELPGGIAYIVAAAVVIADEAVTAAALANVLIHPQRKRPFHWHDEGPTARRRLIDCLIEVGAVAQVCIHYPTGRKRTEAARADGLRRLIPRLIAEGTTELIIESRDATSDRRDQGVILDTLQSLDAPGALTYSWRPKPEPFLWLADGVCGAVREFLLDTDDAHYYHRLRGDGVIDEPIYINEQSGSGYA